MLDRVYNEFALGGFNFICGLAGERAEKAKAKCTLKNSIRCHWKGSSYRLAKRAALPEKNCQRNPHRQQKQAQLLPRLDPAQPKLPCW